MDIVAALARLLHDLLLPVDPPYAVINDAIRLG
jgi:hypothetical protein